MVSEARICPRCGRLFFICKGGKRRAKKPHRHRRHRHCKQGQIHSEICMICRVFGGKRA